MFVNESLFAAPSMSLYAMSLSSAFCYGCQTHCIKTHIQLFLYFIEIVYACTRSAEFSFIVFGNFFFFIVDMYAGKTIFIFK